MKPFLARLDRLQRQHRVVGLPVAVFKRFGEHNGNRLATAVSYFSFFSVFPLLLVFVTILGLVLEGREDLRDDLVEGALGQIPVIGDQLASEQDALGGSVVALVVGLATALWAGLRAIGALQQGLDELSDIAAHDRPSFVGKQVRSLVFLVAFGVGLAGSTLLSNLTQLLGFGPVILVVGLAATFVVNVVILGAMFSVLPAIRRSMRDMLPGAVAGALVLLGVQHVGNFVVNRFISGADDTYGTFAIVIALLSWFHLISRIVFLAAEVNGVVSQDLVPRSLVRDAEPTPADQRAAELDRRRVESDPRLAVSA